MPQSHIVISPGLAERDGSTEFANRLIVCLHVSMGEDYYQIRIRHLVCLHTT